MKIYAHRGASGYAPENTMQAFELARDMGADGIELDVHYTKDGKLAVMHDFTLERTTELNGFIFEKNYDELADARCRMPGGKPGDEGIPLLEDVLKFVSKNSLGVYIELKAGSILYKGIEADVIEQMKRAKLEYEQVLFASFDHEAAKRIKVEDKHCLTGLLTSCRLYEAEKYIKNVPADEYCADFFTLDPAYGAELKYNDIKVNCYTPNTLWDYQFVKNLDCIDKMVTNYPDKACLFFNNEK